MGKILSKSAILIVVMSIIAFTQIVSAEQQMIDLGTLPGGFNSVAKGINDYGQIVGASDSNAFIWQDGLMTDLGTLSGENFTSATSINNIGQIVGNSAIFGNVCCQAVLLQNGEWLPLGTLSGDTYSKASCINDSGQIVGESSNSQALIRHALIWQEGVMTSLGTLGGTSHSFAYAVNNSGQVVGGASTSDGLYHAFLWQDGIMTDLGTLGGSYSYATGINNLRQIVGYSQTSNGSTHAFLWQDGTMMDLGTIGEPPYSGSSYANDINDAGKVVGYSSTSTPGATHAFLWQNGIMTDLGSLGGSSYAVAINNAGQIVGYSGLPSGYSHAVLWKEKPPAVTAGVINLSKTGQTKCYDTVGTEITCTGTGQDGEIQAGAEWPNPRFAITYCDANGPCANQDSDCDDNSSTDVVVDNLTGLVWARNRNLTNGPITWYQAVDYSNNLNLCGYSDWRLLNVNELESLLNADETDMNAWLSAEGFTSEQSCGYWSSTTVAGTTDAAWTYIENGPVLAAAKDYSNFYVWPVRAGQCGLDNSVICLPRTGQTASYVTGDDGDLQKGIEWPNPRFTDNENETVTVTDNVTGLIWTKNANAPGPSVCNPGTLKTWQEALDYVACINTYSYLGYDDWRLPNRKELRSLIDYSRDDPALQLGHPFISVQLSNYWSSTTYANYANTSNAWDVFMWRGDEYYNSKDATNHVWPVRAGEVRSFGNLEIDPASYDFGSITVGNSSAPQTLIITNTGTADLHISRMTLSDTTNYILDVNRGTSPCGSPTPTIMPDSSCTVTVTFSPLSTGQRNASLTIQSDDIDTPTLNVLLSGIGEGPFINKILGIKAPGSIVRIIGNNFGDTQGNSVIHIGPKVFDSSSPRIKLWSDSKIRIRLPKYQCAWFQGQDFRYIRVWVTTDGVDSNKKRIKVLRPDTCL
jgi:probable HAF family extracellular repeat protein